MRYLHPALVTALAAGLLAGCSPGPVPILAVAARDGRPVALVVPCGGDADVAVHAEGQQSHWNVRGPMSDSVAEVPLLAEPLAGWEGGGTAFLQPARGVRYEVWADSGRRAKAVWFTVDEVERLRADQVLVSGDGDGRTVDRGRFEEEGHEACD